MGTRGQKTLCQWFKKIFHLKNISKASEKFHDSEDGEEFLPILHDKHALALFPFPFPHFFDKLDCAHCQELKSPGLHEPKHDQPDFPNYGKSCIIDYYHMNLDPDSGRSTFNYLICETHSQLPRSRTGWRQVDYPNLDLEDRKSWMRFIYTDFTLRFRGSYREYDMVTCYQAKK
uniref:Uncharacterized protein n=1 Tax=Romanomermis culicivorax TaxID=13658 RepID=A0A915IT68_ROMCU